MLRKLWLRKLIVVIYIFGEITHSVPLLHFQKAASGCWSFYMYILFFNVLKLKVKDIMFVSYVTLAGELKLNFCKFLKPDKCAHT
jgi:hypothetical protein